MTIPINKRVKKNTEKICKYSRYVLSDYLRQIYFYYVFIYRDKAINL